MAKDNIEHVRETSPLLPKKSHEELPSSSLAATSSCSNTRSTGLRKIDARQSSLLSLSTSWLTFISLFSALVNCLWAGSALIFSLYSAVFLDYLGYRQMQINAVSVASEIGTYLPVPVFGFICDRYGPGRLSLLSGLFFGFGYSLAAATFIRRWDSSLMVVSFGFIGMGTSSMYFSGVTACAKNFAGTRRRGLALALPIAAFGLSSLWQAQLVSRVFGDPTAPGGLRVDRMFVFFAVSLTIVGAAGFFGLQVGSAKLEEESDEEGEVDELDERDKGRWLNKDTREFLKDKTMWGFATGVFLATGPGEAFINNMGILIQTIRPHATTTASPNGIDPALQVSLIALMSTIARITAGSVSDYLAPATPITHILPPQPSERKSRYETSRMTILFICNAITFVGFFLIASGYIHHQTPPTLFWLVSSCVGAGYGSVFCLAPTIVSVVWGTKNFGTNWGIVTMTPALGAIVYGCLFASEFDAGAGADGKCVGWACVRWSFGAMTVSVVVAIAGWLWAWRSWRQRGIAV